MTWTFTVKEDLKSHSGPRWKTGWVVFSCELAQDWRVTATSIRDATNSTGDAGSSRLGGMPP